MELSRLIITLESYVVSRGLCHSPPSLVLVVFYPQKVLCAVLPYKICELA